MPVLTRSLPKTWFVTKLCEKFEGKAGGEKSGKNEAVSDFERLIQVVNKPIYLKITTYKKITCVTWFYSYSIFINTYKTFWITRCYTE